MFHSKHEAGSPRRRAKPKDASLFSLVLFAKNRTAWWQEFLKNMLFCCKGESKKFSSSLNYRIYFCLRTRFHKPPLKKD